MSNQPVLIDLAFPDMMVDVETTDVGDRVEMMRNTRSGLSTFAMLWDWVEFAVLGALVRREYRDQINAYYRNADKPHWEAINEEGHDFVGVEIRCTNINSNDEGHTVGTFQFNDPKLAMIIKLAAKTPKDRYSFQ